MNGELIDILPDGFATPFENTKGSICASAEYILHAGTT